jgi:hypothetical protein
MICSKRRYEMITTPRILNLSSLVLALAFSLTPTRATDESQSGSDKLEGTWFTQVTIRDCNTGAVLRTFPSLGNYLPGGTSTDTTTGISPTLRSPGFGTWEKTGGQTYSAVALAFLFNPVGTWTGMQKLSHIIRLKGDVIDYTSTVQFFDTDGKVTASGCATAVGHRL